MILKVWILLWRSGTAQCFVARTDQNHKKFLLGERAGSFRPALISVHGTTTLHEVR